LRRFHCLRMQMARVQAMMFSV